MKKSIKLIALLVSLVGLFSIAAAQRPAEDTYQGCLQKPYNKNHECSDFYYKDKDIQAFMDCANPVYNECSCEYLNKPWAYGNFEC